MKTDILVDFSNWSVHASFKDYTVKVILRKKDGAAFRSSFCRFLELFFRPFSIFLPKLQGLFSYLALLSFEPGIPFAKINRMKKMLQMRRPSFTIALLLAIFFVSVAETAHAQRRARYTRSRTPVSRPAASAPTSSALREPEIKIRPKLSPEEAAAKIGELCAQIKGDMKEMTAEELPRCRARLTTACTELVRLLDRDPNRQAAGYWRETLKIPLLQKTLATQGDLDDAVLAEIWQAFHADRSGVKWLVFEDVRRELRRYRTFSVLQGEAYKAQLEGVCDNLGKYIEEYGRNVDPGYGTALSEVVCWLEDISVFDARAAELASLVLTRFSAPNLQASASLSFVGVPFATELEETFPINESILGTSVRGQGSISGKSYANFVPAQGKAEIKLIVDIDMKSTTTGQQSPVTLSTDTTGTMRGEKTIVFTPEGVSVTPARTKADLKANIHNIRVNGGPVVQNVARNQIQQRRGASQAEAQRRAERRMDGRIDDQLNPRIAEMNANYNTKIRTPLMKTGLFPRIFDVASTTDDIGFAMLVGDPTQVGAAAPVAPLEGKPDVFVRVHQSALNNAATIVLAGKAFDEEQVIADLEKQFNELPPGLQRPEDQQPIQLTFAARDPISVSFVDGRIKAIFRVDTFVQEENRYPGLDITLVYDVKTAVEEVDGEKKVRIILEQAEAPEAFPRNFVSGSGQRISARHQAIRTIVLRRLETLAKTVEGKPQQLKGEWEGEGLLVPVFAEAKDGWLTFAWNWIPKQ